MKKFFFIFLILMLLTMNVAIASEQISKLETFTFKNKLYLSNNDEFLHNYTIIYDNKTIQTKVDSHSSKIFNIQNTRIIKISKYSDSIFSQSAEIEIKDDKITTNAIGSSNNTTFLDIAAAIMCISVISFITFRISKQNERKEL